MLFGIPPPPGLGVAHDDIFDSELSLAFQWGPQATENLCSAPEKRLDRKAKRNARRLFQRHRQRDLLKYRAGLCPWGHTAGIYPHVDPRFPFKEGFAVDWGSFVHEVKLEDILCSEAGFREEYGEGLNTAVWRKAETIPGITWFGAAVVIPEQEKISRGIAVSIAGPKWEEATLYTVHHPRVCARFAAACERNVIVLETLSCLNCTRAICSGVFLAWLKCTTAEAVEPDEVDWDWGQYRDMFTDGCNTIGALWLSVGNKAAHPLRSGSGSSGSAGSRSLAQVVKGASDWDKYPGGGPSPQPPSWSGLVTGAPPAGSGDAATTKAAGDKYKEHIAKIWNEFGMVQYTNQYTKLPADCQAVSRDIITAVCVYEGLDEGTRLTMEGPTDTGWQMSFAFIDTISVADPEAWVTALHGTLPPLLSIASESRWILPWDKTETDNLASAWGFLPGEGNLNYYAKVFYACWGTFLRGAFTIQMHQPTLATRRKPKKTQWYSKEAYITGFVLETCPSSAVMCNSPFILNDYFAKLPEVMMAVDLQHEVQRNRIRHLFAHWKWVATCWRFMGMVALAKCVVVRWHNHAHNEFECRAADKLKREMIQILAPPVTKPSTATPSQAAYESDLEGADEPEPASADRWQRTAVINACVEQAYKLNPNIKQEDLINLVLDRLDEICEFRSERDLMVACEIIIQHFKSLRMRPRIIPGGIFRNLNCNTGFRFT